MAGGEGTRLRPLASNIPKPMVPVMNKPVMEHIINLLRKHGIYDIVVTMCYLPNAIMDYFDTGETLGVNLRYYIDGVFGSGTAAKVKEFQSSINKRCGANLQVDGIY